MAGSTQRRPARARRNGAASLKSRPELSSGRLAIRGAQPGRDEGHPVPTRGEPGEATPPTRAAALPLPPPPPSRASSPHTTALEAAGSGHCPPGAADTWSRAPRPAHLPPAGCTPRRAEQGRTGPGRASLTPFPGLGAHARAHPSIHPPGRPARYGGLRQVGRSGAGSPQPQATSRGAGRGRRQENAAQGRAGTAAP